MGGTDTPEARKKLLSQIPLGRVVRSTLFCYSNFHFVQALQNSQHTNLGALNSVNLKMLRTWLLSWQVTRRAFLLVVPMMLTVGGASVKPIDRVEFVVVDIACEIIIGFVKL